ncbi:MAG: cupredoxin domain-containing protein [Thaumarchaeota archaeon]|nr:cupredoxin domain-containing protein [Nitrososphaerota archaeon]
MQTARPTKGGRGRTIAIIGVVIIIAVAAGAYYFFTSRPRTVPVTIPNGISSNQTLNFTPKAITVVVGVNNTIQWTNQDSAAHTVTSTSIPSGASSFDSGNLNAGATFTVTLTTPGTYHYLCSIHPAWMIATIIVKSG